MRENGNFEKDAIHSLGGVYIEFKIVLPMLNKVFHVKLMIAVKVKSYEGTLEYDNVDLDV